MDDSEAQDAAAALPTADNALPLRAVLADLARRAAGPAAPVRVHGAEGSLLALVCAHLAAQANSAARRPLVVVARSTDAAEALARDLSFWLPEPSVGDGRGEDPGRAPRAMLYPDLETSPWADVSPDRRAILRRMGVLFRLAQRLTGEVLVVSPQGLMRRVVPRSVFGDLVDVIQESQEIDRERLLALLVAAGYSRAHVVEDAGTFAVRGGVIDVFVPLYRFPVRIELFGDLVETLRFFDPETQRTLRTIPEIFIHPVRETVRSGAETDGLTLRERILHAADAVMHPSAKTRALLEQIDGGEDFFGIESLTPAFHPRMEMLADYLPQGDEAIWIIDEPELVLEEVEREYKEGEEAWARRVEERRIGYAPEAFYASREDIAAQLARPRRIESRALEVVGASGKAQIPALRIHGSTNAALRAELKQAMAEKHDEHILRPLIKQVQADRDEGVRTLLVSPNHQHAERLESLLRGYGLRPTVRRAAGIADLFTPPPGGDPFAPVIEYGPLVHGFRLPDDAMTVITEAEIFGERSVRKPVKQKKVDLADSDSFKQLEPGSFVVHRVHGVGVYKGLAKLPIGVRGSVNVDFLQLEYDGGALYLPVWRLDEVQRYVGAEGHKPRVDKLGGVTWSKTKGKVSKEVQKLAEDLLLIYAQRKALPGHGFLLDAHQEQMFHEFESTFAFEETPDQQKAIDDVLADMEQDRPMDRLVCGDVGYGKTEVALRAAVKAVLGGRQVAVLAPTTVLAEQHALTFTERVKDFPIRVESLSRFTHKNDQGRILKGLGDGTVDIVIGTHRLLSNDVRFKHLGLIVVDEEQRFGVGHKEKLKAIRAQVDVLTMSATPIPRTLHMALMGLREISLITTAPVDRLAVRTLLARYEDTLLVEGVKKELTRGGQIFFVHNRIESIYKWQQKFRELMPEVKTAVGHGQMPPDDLEKVMVDFVDGKTDVLICTTIIESGLDIPRANTMFVDRADTFGLAQLYQLRGRIGRSKERAFCYLLVPPEAAMSTDAKQRLAVLQRFSELGAGFQIASHDLEIRGAGDLLGGKQSGSIAAVGFELFTQMIEEAVAALKGEAIHEELDPEMSCDLAGYIPDEYLPDPPQRLDFYKRFSSARNEEEVASLVAELADRFGTPPPEVEVLSEIMLVKGIGRRLGATAIELTEARLALALSERTPLKPEQVLRLVNAKKSPWRLTPDMRLMRHFVEGERNNRLGIARGLLGELLLAASAVV